MIVMPNLSPPIFVCIEYPAKQCQYTSCTNYRRGRWDRTWKWKWRWVTGGNDIISLCSMYLEL